MQRYASDVAIQLWSHCTDKDALLDFEQISVFLVADYLEVITCHMHVATCSHVLHGCIYLHASQWLPC